MKSAISTETKEPQLIPENGSVVIIDDQPDQALPIVKALSKKGIATTYYQGNVKEELPAEPIQNIRLLFLDLQIIETSDENQIAKSIVNVLLKIISKHNGPYLLVIWSKKYNTYAKAVMQEIHQHNHLIPACVVNFDKAACLESKRILTLEPDFFLEKLNDLLEGQLHADDVEIVQTAVANALNDEFKTEYVVKSDAVEIIESQLKTELEKAGAFHLFVIWENLIKRAAAKMVFDVSSLVNNNEHWEINMKNVFKRMGVARVGQNIVSDDILIREAINTLNTSLVDNIETEIKNEVLPASLTLISDVIIADKIENSSYIFKSSDGKDSFFKDENKLFGPTETKGFKSGLEKSTKIDATDKKAFSTITEKYKFLPYSLNTKLHIELLPSQELIPGNIYYNVEAINEKKTKYLKTFFKEVKGNEADYYLIDLEVSPVCDYAQNKWKRSRTLPGVLFPADHAANLISKANNHYDVEPIFDIDGKQYKFRFDFHLFNALDVQGAKAKKVVYRFKRELLLDIIAQLSSHVNRPGISFIQ